MKLNSAMNHFCNKLFHFVFCCCFFFLPTPDVLWKIVTHSVPQYLFHLLHNTKTHKNEQKKAFHSLAGSYKITNPTPEVRGSFNNNTFLSWQSGNERTNLAVWEILLNVAPCFERFRLQRKAVSEEIIRNVGQVPNNWSTSQETFLSLAFFFFLKHPLYWTTAFLASHHTVCVQGCVCVCELTEIMTGEMNLQQTLKKRGGGKPSIISTSLK